MNRSAPTILTASALLVAGLVALNGRTDTSDQPIALSTDTTTTTTTPAPTTSTTSTTSSTTTTTLVFDSPLFVSADYPALITPGTTVTFTVVCSRPIEVGDSPGVFVSSSSTPAFFDALSADVSHTENGFSADWSVPADGAVGDYTAVFSCDGRSDVILPPGVAYPPGIASAELPVRVGYPEAPATGLPDTE